MLSIQNDNYQNEELFINDCITKNGLQFNPNLNIWNFNDVYSNTTFNFTKLHISSKILYGIKRTLVWYLENKSLKHSSNMYSRLKHLFDYFYKANNKEIYDISITDLKNYKNSLDKKHIWYLGALSGFLKQWHAMGYFGLSKEAYDYLNNIHLKGNQKRSICFNYGPLQWPFYRLRT